MTVDEEVHTARAASLRDSLLVSLREAFDSLDESLAGLTDQQAWGFPLPHRHSILTIAQHCLENLDSYALQSQTGASVVPYEQRFDMWRFGPEDVRPQMLDLPTVAETRRTIGTLRAAALPVLEVASDAELAGPCLAGPASWQAHSRSRAETYLRTISHTMCHVRQIWMLRGVMGLTDVEGWPKQHWA